MDKRIIYEIQSKLTKDYPGYRFEMKEYPSVNGYKILAIKQGKQVGTISFASTTPMDKFWEQIREWMRAIYTI